MRASINFYKEANFKETPIGKIPKDWRAARLIDAADYINGYHFGPKDWKKSGLPIIRIQNLNDPNAEFNYFQGEIDDKYRVDNGDLLFSWSASIGVYIWKRGKAVLNQHIFKVFPRKGIDKTYLYYALFQAIEQLKQRIHGSTMKHFKRTELKATYVTVPPLNEQQRIAEVLSCIDLAIEKVDEAIARAERLKKGLMQQLLIKGIGHKEFKETPIGKTPKTWKISRLNEAIVECKTGIPVKKQDRISGPYPYFGANGIIDYVHDYIFDGEYVIVAQDGSIGAVHYFNGKFWANNHVWVIKTRAFLHVKFLYYFFQTLNWKTLSTGSTRPKVTEGVLLRVIIPIPPFKEQEKIADILSSVDKILQLKKEKKEKLIRMKKRLMDLLLTGKVRVSV